MDISHWRDKIDSADQRLVALLNERAGYVLEIGAIKKQMRAPVHEPRREMQIMENIHQWNKGPLEDSALTRVFERIIDEMRAIQRGPMGEPRKD
jgi:chorismate mutase